MSTDLRRVGQIHSEDHRCTKGTVHRRSTSQVLRLLVESFETIDHPDFVVNQSTVSLQHSFNEPTDSSQGAFVLGLVDPRSSATGLRTSIRRFLIADQ
jgi:hypothetical protein